MENLEARLTPTVSITRTSAPVFYTDNSPPAGAPQMRGNYATFQITNNGATIDDAWVTIGNFSAASGPALLGLGTNSPGSVNLGKLTAGATKMAAFYVVENDAGVAAVGTTGSSITQNYTINVFNDSTSGPLEGTAGFSYADYTWPGGSGSDKAISDDIKASANTVSSITYSPDPSVLGGTFTMVVQGDTGTVGSSKVLAFSPAAYLSWRPDVFQLINTSIVLRGGNTGTYTDQLFISATNSASTAYTASYTFRAIGTTASSTSVNPTAFISSGTNNKHTDPKSFANLPPILPPVNTMLLAKSVSNSLIDSAGQVTYTLTMTNSSATQTASFDKFVDQLPSLPGVVTYVPGSTLVDGVPVDDPIISGQTLTWTNSWNSTYSIPPSGSVKLNYKANIPSNVGQYVNSAIGYAGTTQLDTTPDTKDNKPAKASVTLAPISDLGVTKTDNVGGILTPGGSVTYTITVTNAGPSSAIGASIVDALPTGIATATVSGVVATGGATITSVDHTGGSINDVATIPNGGTIVYTVTATISGTPPPSVDNTVTVTAPSGYVDPNPDNNTSTDVIGNATADLSITKSDGTTTAIPGTNTTYTITVSNAGPTSVTGAEVTDILPSGVTFVSATNGASYDSATRKVTFVTPTIGLGSSTNFDLVIAISPELTGTLSNTATVAVPAYYVDPDPTNNTSTDTDTLVPTADLSIVKDDSAPPVIPGNTITYTIAVSNNGPSTMSGATVTDVLPAELAFVSSTGGANYNPSTRTITYTTGTLISGATTAFQISAQIDPSATGTLSNTATVTPPSGVVDPDPSNDTSTDTDKLKPTGDLSIVKTDGTANAIPGTLITYTITVTNAGPSTATGATIVDSLPASLLGGSVTNVVTTGGALITSASHAGGNINDVATIPSGGTIVYTVSATISPTATGTLANTATVAGPSGWTDPDPTNDTSTDTDTLVPSADLGVLKSGPATGIAGDLITYTITVTNYGPSSSQNASFSDTLPAGVTLVSQTQLSGPSFILSATGGIVTGSIGNLLPATPAVFQIVVSVPNPIAPGLKVTNTVTVTSPTADPDPNNNTSKVETILDGSPITGTVFIDRDHDAVMDAGDARLGGTIIKLVDSLGQTIASTTSAVDGTYSFFGVRPGTYTVVEVQPNGYAPSTPITQPVILPPGGLADVNFGQTLGALEGCIFYDVNNNGIREPGEAGLTDEIVTLTGVDINGLPVTRSITTSIDGWFGFGDLVAPNANGYTLSETQPSKYAQGINKTGTAGGVINGDVISQISLKAGQIATGYTYGERGTVITGTVFLDLDKTTTFTPKDEGLAGIPVVLLNGNGLQVGYALTNSDGTYLFGGVIPGNYQVVFTPPGGYTAILPTSRQVSVPASGITGLDLPLINTKNTLGGFVYIDLNNDGARQPGEPGIAGVTLTLANGGFTSTTTTSPDGSYIFINVPNGTFTLTETQPTGYSQGKTTIGSAGGSSTIPDVVTSIVLNGGNNSTGYNFGELGARISGNVFNDINGNGILNSGDTGKGGVTLTLRDQTGLVVGTTTSQPDGSYSFGALIPGTYTLTETVPGGQTPTSPTSMTLTVPPSGLKDQNFGLSANSSLTGAVYEDINHNGKRDIGEPGIPGVLVTLTGTSGTNAPVNVTALTGADGIFVIPNLAASNASGYLLTETPPSGYLKGPDSVGTSGGTKVGPGAIGAIVLESGTAAKDYLFGEWSKQGTITGSVFLDSNNTGNPANQPPIGGVVILLRDQLGNVVASTKTASDGSYFFNDVPPGNYTIEEQKPASRGISPNTPSTVLPVAVPPTGGLLDGNNFGLVLATVAGTVFSDKNNSGIQDPGEPGIPGVVLKVYDAFGTLVATTTTDSDGKYLFTNLPAGQYTIVETQPPFYVSGKESVGSLGGTSGDNTFTLNVPAGATGTGYNFAQLPVADPVGFVFSDLNNNGVRDPGEPGIPGVKVRMTGTDIQGNSITVNGVTDNTGLYVFAYRDQASTLPLLPGVYNLFETQPPGWFDGKLQNGTPPATIVTDNAFIGIDLTNPPFFGSGYNFGEIKPSTLGGSVFIDKNNNGKREAGDLGVGGVTIRLTGKDYKGNLVNATVVTDANGYYSFKGIAPGNYTLTEVVPANYIAGVSKAGSGLSNNGNGGTTRITNIVVGPGQTGVQANFGILGLVPNLISKRNFLTTTPVTSVARAGVPGTGISFVNHP